MPCTPKSAPAPGWLGKHGQLASLNVIDAIRALGKDTLPRAEGPALVARQRAEILGPARYDFVRSRRIEEANGAWDGSQTAAAR